MNDEKAQEILNVLSTQDFDDWYKGEDFNDFISCNPEKSRDELKKNVLDTIKIYFSRC